MKREIEKQNYLPWFFSLDKIFLLRSFQKGFYFYSFIPSTWINFSLIFNFTLSLLSLMLHCRKEMKSDGSKYNILLFSFVSHLQEGVFIHKEK